MLLGAFPAVATNSMGILKNCVFNAYDRKGKNIPVWILVVYSSIIISLGILTFNNVFSIISIFWSVLSAYATWQNDLKKFRIFTVIIVSSMLIYNVIVGAYANALGNIFQLTVTLISIFKLDIVIKNRPILLNQSNVGWDL